MATYTVQTGDSLSKIARDVLGDMSRWTQIAAANGIEAPYTIFPGQVLILPNDAVALAPIDQSLYKGAAARPPPARATINWPLIALALTGIGLQIWFKKKK